MNEKTPIAIDAKSVEPRAKSSNYPEPFASRVSGRIKRQLGSPFGLNNLGVNLTVLQPGSESSVMHRHSMVDEFIYILEGEPLLVTDEGEVPLRPGMCAGFPANGRAHHLVNRSSSNVVYLEISDRSSSDEGEYPNDDLSVKLDENGEYKFMHKDGTPYN